MKRVYSPMRLDSFFVMAESSFLEGSQTEEVISAKGVVIENMTEDPDADFLDITFNFQSK